MHVNSTENALKIARVVAALDASHERLRDLLRQSNASIVATQELHYQYKSMTDAAISRQQTRCSELASKLNAANLSLVQNDLPPIVSLEDTVST